MDEQKLIDELVHCTEPEKIMSLVKQLVPEANDRTAELYARYTEYMPDSYVDKVMDEPSEFGRMRILAKEFPYLDADERLEIFRMIPYAPLTDDQRLYRLRQVRWDMSVTRENKYLADEKFTAEEWNELPPEHKYAIRAMKNNTDLTPEDAAELVFEMMTKSTANNVDTSDEKNFTPPPQGFLYIDFIMETPYPERVKILSKLDGEDDEAASDSASDFFLNNLRSIADPNFHIKSIIAVDAHIDALHAAEGNR